MLDEYTIYHSINITFLLGLLFISAHTIKITINIRDYEFIFVSNFNILQWIILIGIYFYDCRYYFYGFCVILYLYINYLIF